MPSYELNLMPYATAKRLKDQGIDIDEQRSTRAAAVKEQRHREKLKHDEEHKADYRRHNIQLNRNHKRDDPEIRTINVSEHIAMLAKKGVIKTDHAYEHSKVDSGLATRKNSVKTPESKQHYKEYRQRIYKLAREKYPTFEDAREAVIENPDDRLAKFRLESISGYCRRIGKDLDEYLATRRTRKR